MPPKRNRPNLSIAPSQRGTITIPNSPKTPLEYQQSPKSPRAKSPKSLSPKRTPLNLHPSTPLSRSPSRSRSQSRSRSPPSHVRRRSRSRSQTGSSIVVVPGDDSQLNRLKQLKHVDRVVNANISSAFVKRHMQQKKHNPHEERLKLMREMKEAKEREERERNQRILTMNRSRK